MTLDRKSCCSEDQSRWRQALVDCRATHVDCMTHALDRACESRDSSAGRSFSKSVDSDLIAVVAAEDRSPS